MKSPIVLLRNLLIDFSRLEPDVEGLDRDIITIEKRYENEGYGFLSVALPTLGKALQQGLSTGWFHCPLGFKRTPRGAIPRIFSGMFLDVFEPITGRVKEDPNFGTIKNLYQILFFFKKIQLSEESNDKLHSKACSEFFSNDLIATEVVFPDRESFRLSVVSRFILPSLRVNSYGEIACKHGPGAVKEGLKANQKWMAVADSIFQDSFDTAALEYDTFATSFDSLLSSELKGLSSYAKPSQSFDYGASRSTARLISVPKNSTSNRTITVEPVLNQFVQQGLNTILRDSILQCSILRQCLALSDQTKNQQLALEGSRTGEWATIDLKSASDLLSVKLVKLVFGSHEEFLTHAINCRTPKVDDMKNIIEIGKFAGMGNALTFPIQSIVFAVVAITAILDLRQVRASKRNLMHAARHIRVYGDDIIIHTKYAHQVVNWLKLFGLAVNESKSFLTGNFKESCGVDAYMGVEITPIYIKPRPDQPSVDPSDIASLVSLSNQLWMEGLYSTSACIMREVEERLGYSLPLVSRDAGSLGWHSRLDSSFATKWCRKTHQLLVRAPVVLSKLRKDKLDGWAALLKFFHVPLVGRPVNHLQQTSTRFQLRIAQRWVPVRLSGTVISP
jgi:hypothetical protein